VHCFFVLKIPDFEQVSIAGHPVFPWRIVPVGQDCVEVTQTPRQVTGKDLFAVGVGVAVGVGEDVENRLAGWFGCNNFNNLFGFIDFSESFWLSAANKKLTGNKKLITTIINIFFILNELIFKI